MFSLRTLVVAVLLLGTLLVSSVAHAHQQKESYTTVLFNQRSGNLEVSHRFYIHDAEHALASVLGRKADLSSDLQSQKDFAAYITQTFALKDQQGNSIQLLVVGHEREGKYFWVYQETPIPEGITSFEVMAKALQEVWPRQTNQVNVEKNGLVRSARLTKDDNWKRIILD